MNRVHVVTLGVSDMDGYYWEVKYWEDWKFKDDGSLLIG